MGKQDAIPDWRPPTVLPPAWRMVQLGEDGAAYKCDSKKLAVIVSVAREADLQWWLHLSISHRERLPRWSEIVDAKEIFLGQREAYEVVPPRERYVNIRPRTRHVFARLDGTAVLPDFNQGTRSL